MTTHLEHTINRDALFMGLYLGHKFDEQNALNAQQTAEQNRLQAERNALLAQQNYMIWYAMLNPYQRAAEDARVRKAKEAEEALREERRVALIRWRKAQDEQLLRAEVKKGFRRPNGKVAWVDCMTRG